MYNADDELIGLEEVWESDLEVMQTLMECHPPRKDQVFLRESLPTSPPSPIPVPEPDIPGPQSRYAVLAKQLMSEKRNADLLKSIHDLEYREQLYREYGIRLKDGTWHFKAAASSQEYQNQE